jgi:hypothetical protein
MFMKAVLREIVGGTSVLIIRHVVLVESQIPSGLRGGLCETFLILQICRRTFSAELFGRILGRIIFAWPAPLFAPCGGSELAP